MRTYLRIFLIISSLLLGRSLFAFEDPDELYRQGKFAEAEEAYSRLDIENPKDIRFRYNRGCAAYQNSDFQTAAAAFTSVLRRTEDKMIKSKTAYNLGNIAFKQGDFQSAVKYYSQAIKHEPGNEDAQYNLELALREIEKQKAQEQDNEEQQSQQDSEKEEEGKKESKDDQKGKQSGKQSGDQERKGEDEKEKSEGDGQQAEQEEPEDLSGELESSQAMPEQKDISNHEQSGEELDKNKAEALLDNLIEDRSKFMRFQIPKDKRDGVGSGKDW